MKRVTLIAMAITLLVAVSGSGAETPKNEAPAKTCPVSLESIDIRGGKPPLRFYVTKLAIRNSHDRPVWFVFRYWGDAPLVQTGPKITRKDQEKDEHILQGAAYDGAKLGGTGRIILVTDVGHFRAIRVPAKGAIRFDRFSVEAWKSIEGTEVWEVEDLSVNGRVPVEKWLPYETMSDAGARVTGDKGLNWDNLDWDPSIHGDRKDLRKEKVESIHGKVLAKWPVPITGLDGKKNQDPWR